MGGPPLSRRQVLGMTAAWALLPNSLTAENPPRRLVLWSAGLRSKPLVDRLRAAEEAGFTHISVFPIDVQQLLDQGQTMAQVGRTVRSSGVGVVACDPFTQWVPDWKLPEGYPESYRAFVDFDEAFIFRMADALGAQSVNCVEPFGVRYEAAVLTDALGAFAERAGAEGLRVAHEFMPISGVPDLATAWPFVQPLGDNVGLTFDTWHFHRSDPDHRLLRTVPGHRIFEVQLADALLEVQGGDLVTDLLGYRRYPGDGEFDLGKTIETLRQIEALKSIGPEVFSYELDEQSAERVALDSRSSLERFGLM